MTTASSTKPAILFEASAGGERVAGLEVGGQVDAERDVAAERDGVERGRAPGDRQPGGGRRGGRRTVRPCAAGRGASRSTSAATVPYTASAIAVTRNGAAMPCAPTSLTVVRALIAVPPMPAPKTPMAMPRRLGGNQALTNGTPTAKAVPAMPRKNPPTSSAAKLEWPARPRNSTGMIVTNDTAGSMTRPPNRSVSAPTGMRPSEPTSTGTATSRACWNEDSCNAILNFGASGDSSAQAQKLRAKPSVAIASITVGRRSRVAVAAVPRFVRHCCSSDTGRRLPSTFRHAVPGPVSRSRGAREDTGPSACRDRPEVRSHEPAG